MCSGKEPPLRARVQCHSACSRRKAQQHQTGSRCSPTQCQIVGLCSTSTIAVNNCCCEHHRCQNCCCQYHCCEHRCCETIAVNTNAKERKEKRRIRLATSIEKPSIILGCPGPLLCTLLLVQPHRRLLAGQDIQL